MRRAACARGEGQTDRVGFVPFPPSLARARFSIWGPTLASACSWCRSRRPSRHRGTFSSRDSSSAPAAASPQASRRSWASSACTAAAARLVSPAPYTSAPKLLRRLWAAFFSPVGVSAWTASSVSAPRLFHWASALHWGANSATAAASRPCGAPYRRSTQRVSSAKSHQPLIFLIFTGRTPHPVRPALRRPTAGPR